MKKVSNQVNLPCGSNNLIQALLVGLSIVPPTRPPKIGTDFTLTFQKWALETFFGVRPIDFSFLNINAPKLKFQKLSSQNLGTCWHCQRKTIEWIMPKKKNWLSMSDFNCSGLGRRDNSQHSLCTVAIKIATTWFYLINVWHHYRSLFEHALHWVCQSGYAMTNLCDRWDFPVSVNFVMDQ